MFSNFCNQIKNKCFLGNQAKIQPLSVKQLPLQLQLQTKPSYITNKLISSYEEDYTRNNKDITIMRQRN